MKVISRVLLIFALLTDVLLAQTYFPSPDSTGGWRKNDRPSFVRQLGLVPDAVDRFGEYNLSIRNSQIKGYRYGDYKSALVVKDGWVVGEWYNRGDGVGFKNYVSSVGKSLALVCFGMLIEDSASGAVDHDIRLDSRVYDRRWLPQGFPLSDPAKAGVTFDQVLRHTSGICPQRIPGGRIIEKGRDDWTDYASWVVGRDPRWPQTRDLYFAPGRIQQYPHRERWGDHEGAYSSVGFAHLGLVLANVYAMPAHEFLWQRLLSPIGFGPIDFHKPPQPPRIKWFTAGGLRITTRDFARFAYLLLQRGNWDGEQLISADWLRQMTSVPYYQNMRSNVDGYFGRQFPPDMFRVFGSGGNFAFIIPSDNMIAIRTGRVSNFYMKVLERDFLVRTFLMLPAYAHIAD